jgi:uncharacterized membrane protein
MPRSQGFLLWRIIRSRPRLFSCGALGVVVGAASELTGWRGAARLLVAWDVAVVVYLVLAFDLMARSNTARIRRRASAEDEGALALLVLTVIAGLLSLVAIFVELGGAAQGEHQRAALALAAATILLSWAFIHTIFALHYAHEFYGEEAAEGGGLAFPGGEDEPDYWDFLYFSFVIGMTSQVSDVGVTSKSIRRTVAVHGVVAFVFNTALLAITVNIAASLIPG